MTSKAGLAGLLTGLTATMILVYPLAIAWHTCSTQWIWVAVATAAALTIGGGSLAAHWSRSIHPARCAALGGLAGGLAGAIVFYLLGAAAAGLAGALPLFTQAANDITIQQRLQNEVIVAIVSLTQWTFLASFLSGIGLGALGGWLARPRQENQTDVFDKSAPQMAMNAAITAVPAAVVAATLTAVIFSRLAASIGIKMNEPALASSVLNMPMMTSLLLVLISHFGLTLILPHEARQAEHRCGMDEVKMSAFVGIGAAPILAVLLLIVEEKLFLNPLVVTALLASAVMSLKTLQTLFGLILPRRNSFAVPQNSWQRVEAKWFGTIADSPAQRLMALCIGCGLVMILPLHVTVFSVLINLTILLGPAFLQSAPEELARKLFLTQALTSTGLGMASAAFLISIYLFYLNLGRWFKRWRLRQSNES